MGPAPFTLHRESIGGFFRLGNTATIEGRPSVDVTDAEFRSPDFEPEVTIVPDPADADAPGQKATPDSSHTEHHEADATSHTPLEYDGDPGSSLGESIPTDADTNPLAANLETPAKANDQPPSDIQQYHYDREKNDLLPINLTDNQDIKSEPHSQSLQGEMREKHAEAMDQIKRGATEVKITVPAVEPGPEGEKMLYELTYRVVGEDVIEIEGTPIPAPQEEEQEEEPAKADGGADDTDRRESPVNGLADSDDPIGGDGLDTSTPSAAVSPVANPLARAAEATPATPTSNASGEQEGQQAPPPPQSPPPPTPSATPTTSPAPPSLAAGEGSGVGSSPAESYGAESAPATSPANSALTQAAPSFATPTPTPEAASLQTATVAGEPTSATILPIAAEPGPASQPAPATTEHIMATPSPDPTESTSVPPIEAAGPDQPPKPTGGPGHGAKATPIILHAGESVSLRPVVEAATTLVQQEATTAPAQQIKTPAAIQQTNTPTATRSAETLATTHSAETQAVHHATRAELSAAAKTQSITSHETAQPDATSANTPIQARTEQPLEQSLAIPRLEQPADPDARVTSKPPAESTNAYAEADKTASADLSAEPTPAPQQQPQEQALDHVPQAELDTRQLNANTTAHEASIGARTKTTSTIATRVTAEPSAASLIDWLAGFSSSTEAATGPGLTAVTPRVVASTLRQPSLQAAIPPQPYQPTPPNATTDDINITLTADIPASTTRRTTRRASRTRTTTV